MLLALLMDFKNVMKIKQLNYIYTNKYGCFSLALENKAIFLMVVSSIIAMIEL